MQEKQKSIMRFRCRVKNPFLGIAVRHPPTSLVMSNSKKYPLYRFIYQSASDTHEIFYILAYQIKKSVVFLTAEDSNSFLAQQKFFSCTPDEEILDFTLG